MDEEMFPGRVSLGELHRERDYDSNRLPQRVGTAAGAVLLNLTPQRTVGLMA
jgi:hypothetical protein